MKVIESIIRYVWLYIIPWGNLCVFRYGSQRITLDKNGWITVDSGKGTAKDSLPITLVSQQLVDECEAQLIHRGYC